ncbi:MAG TPA: acyl-CoA carboxylase subunit beta [Thermodesulfobacteriota bacterium]|nr:acyl-CoA carboxylase subunit beta [Thermodesulfobacteriota bacterium]
MSEARRRLAELEAEAERGGGPERVARQHAAGKLTARERLGRLLDPGSFVELDRFVRHRTVEFGLGARRPLGDGVVTGCGTIDGRRVVVFAQDATVFGGSLSKAHAEKICKVMDLALKTGVPIIGLNDSAGARVQEGVLSLAGYAEIFLRHVLASGVVPQISAVMGPCAGGAVYSPALTDFVLAVQGTAYMFVTGPEVVRAVAQEPVTKEELGGALAHAEVSGAAHFLVEDDEACLRLVRELLAYLPSNNLEDPPALPPTDDPERRDPRLAELVPEDSAQPYDMKALIRLVVDDGRLLEVHERFARNLIVGFARLAGRSVGIVASQPAVLAGCLDADAAVKGARFVRFCDAFNIPVVTFADVPGFLPGPAQELGGIVRHGAKLLYAYAEATVPKVTVIVRKAYGGAYAVMGSRQLRGDLVYAYPTAEIAVMGPEAAVGLLYRDRIAAAADPAAERARLAAEYRAHVAGPYRAAELGVVDGVILPEETRPVLVRALALLANKREAGPPRKHGNIPL